MCDPNDEDTDTTDEVETTESEREPSVSEVIYDEVMAL